MAYSAGFNPHPKISYANAAPTGAASEAEYVEIAVTQRCDPELVRAVLDEGLPTGLDVLEVVESRGGALADRLEASEWQVRFDGVEAGELQAAVGAFLAADTVVVERLTKNGIRTFDARGAVATLSVERPPVNGTARHPEGPAAPCAILRVVVRHSTALNALPSVRPDDVITGLRLVAGLAPPVPPSVTRTAQGPLDADSVTVGDPLAPDREAGLG